MDMMYGSQLVDFPDFFFNDRHLKIPGHDCVRLDIKKSITFISLGLPRVHYET